MCALHWNTTPVNGNLASSGLATQHHPVGAMAAYGNLSCSGIWFSLRAGVVWAYATIHSSADVCRAGVGAVLGTREEGSLWPRDLAVQMS